MPFAAVAIAVAVAVAVVAGCSGDDDNTSASTSTSTSAADDGSATTAAPAGDVGDLGDVAVQLVDLDLGADSPIDLAFRTGSTSLLVAERGGAVREAVAGDDGSFELSDDPVIDLTSEVGSTDGERGLLGIAVAPDGEHLYVSYTESDEGDSRIDEYELTGADGSLRADPDSRRELVAIEQPFSNHNGGALRFGTDGMLYAGFGDGGSADDPEGNGQARDTLLGKILRIDPSAPDGIPVDNPFAGSNSVDGTEPLIWSTGVRNPWRIDIDPATGDLWVADVGQNEFEEVSRLAASDGGGKGANLGWDLFEGTEPFGDNDPAPGDASAGPFVEPVLTYTHDEGCSISGGVVVRDPRLAGLDGAYLYGDFCQPWVRAVRVAADGTVSSADLGLEASSVVSFARGPSDEVYVIGLDGTIARLDPA